MAKSAGLGKTVHYEQSDPCLDCLNKPVNVSLEREMKETLYFFLLGSTTINIHIFYFALSVTKL